jgi:hypothetical protein
LRIRDAATVITFSPFSQVREIVTGLTGSTPGLADRWSDRLDLDMQAPGNVTAMMLAWCLSDNPGGTVLFSSTDKDHIRDAVKLACDMKSLEKSVIFGRLVEEELARADGARMPRDNR